MNDIMHTLAPSHLTGGFHFAKGEITMKYYPLEIVDQLQAANDPASILVSLKEQGMCEEDATVEDLYDYAFGFSFFHADYVGKFQKWNYTTRNNTELNKLYFPMFKMSDYEARATEWKDILSIGLTLEQWSKFKMVYKIDNDFFHEIKTTDNIITSLQMFRDIPFTCFYIDLSDVQNISDFRGVFVNLVQDSKTGFIGTNLYMVKGDEQTFFTYYSWYNFNETEELEWKPNDLPDSEFVARSIGLKEDDLLASFLNSDTGYVKVDEYDPRSEIIVAVFQIMSFIAIDASDVNENPTTKQTYKQPSNGSKIKNKFSEIRMWDVGIRYGKAIRTAKKEYEKHLREHKESNNNESKERKPTRPHIRRPHWHKYKVGVGRKDTKTLWLGPIYVCGTHEIPVTIREIKK